ncbi:hypothetical protein COOONC_21939 [Cooperia oncophora]
MRALAKLQAIGMKFSDEEKAHFKLHPYVALFEGLLNKEATDTSIEMLRAFVGERLKHQVDQLEAILPELMDIKLVEELPKSLGMEPVLCHGDFWATNLMWKNSKTNPELRAVIDFQNIHFGCPAVDFVRVFLCLDRREKWESLLEKFYEYLEEDLVDQDMPYTLDMVRYSLLINLLWIDGRWFQLKASYRRFFPLGAFLMLPMFAPTFLVVNSSTDVEFKARVSLCRHK